MDNLPARKGARIEQPINSAEAEWRYLPPCSPDMNPIEKAFSKLKAILGHARRANRRRPDEGARRLRRYLQTRRMHKLPFAACGCDAT
jgi:transposase